MLQLERVTVTTPKVVGKAEREIGWISEVKVWMEYLVDRHMTKMGRKVDRCRSVYGETVCREGPSRGSV